LDTNVILPVQLEIKCSVGAVLDRDFAKAGKGRTMAEKIVLIVDDDEGIVRLVPPMIDREGLRSVAAYDGQEALHLYETLHPDLILLDLAMPVMNGLDVIEAIRRREQGGPRTPIVSPASSRRIAVVTAPTSRVVCRISAGSVGSPLIEIGTSPTPRT